MNSLSLISALTGGLITVLSFQSAEENKADPSQPTFVPAVIRVIQPVRMVASTQAKTPQGGSSTEAMLEENTEEFRKLTSQEIETLSLALDGMVRRSNLGAVGSRSYVNTRLQALREHVDYARSELVKLPSSQGDENFIPAYAHFYRTMKSLEQAFAQAANELNGDI
jgi:hypothetical protein